MTQKQLADRLKVSERFIQYRESGEMEIELILEYAMLWLQSQNKK